MKLFRITALCTDVFGCDLEEVSYTIAADNLKDAECIFYSRLKNEKIFCNVKQITSIIVL